MTQLRLLDGFWHVTSQLELLCGHACVTPMLAPSVLHCSSLLVQYPLAHSRPLLPHDVPSSRVSSAGHSPAVPVQYSAMSHCSFTAGRHSCDVGANWQDDVQHEDVPGSHTAPWRSRHVSRSQQSESASPGSHSSPGSKMPFPH